MPGSTACYYPSLGQARSSIADPHPSNCATVGCSLGVRYLCCADPGPAPSPDAGGARLCAYDPGTDASRIIIVKTDGATCTTLGLVGGGGGTASFTAVSTSAGWTVERATRGPCDGSTAAALAAGAIGTATVVTSTGAPTPPRVSAHVAIFFDDGSGTATPVRLDGDDLGLDPSGCR
jgi:hypothetical protein